MWLGAGVIRSECLTQLREVGILGLWCQASVRLNGPYPTCTYNLSVLIDALLVRNAFEDLILANSLHIEPRHRDRRPSTLAYVHPLLSIRSMQMALILVPPMAKSNMCIGLVQLWAGGQKAIKDNTNVKCPTRVGRPAS